jgi:murein DD-endopeptidase MepM/ murein hydrolase activator NlpD
LGTDFFLTNTNSGLRWWKKVRCPIPFFGKGCFWGLFLVGMLLVAGKGIQSVSANTVSFYNYTVRPGDTLWDIARTHKVELAALLKANTISNANMIHPGQQLRIPGHSGSVTHIVKKGDTYWGLSREYGVTVADLKAANPGLEPRRLLPGSSVLIPGAHKDRQLTSRSDLVLAWPVQGKISSVFGSRWGGYHYGLDIAAPTGTVITAARAGRVSESGWKGSYGQVIVLDHGAGLTTLYAHASRCLVHKGQWVTKGQPIARVGSTGRSTGPHLHFEVRVNDNPVNPIRYLR